MRGKLALLLGGVIALTAAVIATLVSYSTSRAYAQMDEERSTLLANQFQEGFRQRAAEIAKTMDEIAGADSTLQSLVEMSRNPQDYSLFLESAAHMSGDRLELMEVLAADGTIISSKQWPARFGYREDWVAQDPSNRKLPSAFLQPVDLPNGTKLAVMAVREVSIGDRTFHLAGGETLGRELVGRFALLPGIEAVLYSAAPGLSDAQRLVAGENKSIPVEQMDEIAGQVERTKAPAQTMSSGHGYGTHNVYAFPLLDRKNDVAAVLIVSSSREPLQILNRRIRWTAALVASGGVLLGILLSALSAGRVTRPVEELAVAADEVAAGNLSATVDDSRQDEIGSLAYAFNRMTRELLEQREKLVQSERVAAWRELARRLAHEL
ncbi:MAG TPA: HAMP domain-containing protein, partial [Terriglobales bacterium]|nr:HAMP domain-containing protein [Terriglobales bacterium]